MIIDDEDSKRRGNARVKVNVMEYKGSESTGNSMNISFSLYTPDFWTIYNDIGQVLFNNYNEITTGVTSSSIPSRKRVRIMIGEFESRDQVGKTRSFSVRDGSLFDIRNRIETALRNKYKD